jgi:hypothetical protein
MVIRRAYCWTSARVVIWPSLVMMTVGCSRPRPVTISEQVAALNRGDQLGVVS